MRICHLLCAGRTTRLAVLVAVMAALSLAYPKPQNGKSGSQEESRLLGAPERTTKAPPPAAQWDYADRTARRVHLRGKAIDTKQVPSSNAREIRGAAGRPSGKSLGCGVSTCQGRVVVRGLGRMPLENPCDAEIEQLHAAIVGDEHVAGLNVCVHD